MAENSAHNRLYSILFSKCGFQAVKETPGKNQLRVIGRLNRDQWPFMLPVVHKLLTVSVNRPWSIDISRTYLLDTGGSVRYAWRLIFQGMDIESHLEDITSVIASAPRPAHAEVTSTLLPGYKDGDTRDNYNPTTGKGARSAGAQPLIAQTERQRKMEGGR